MKNLFTLTQVGLTSVIHVASTKLEVNRLASFVGTHTFNHENPVGNKANNLCLEEFLTFEEKEVFLKKKITKYFQVGFFL